MGKHYKDPKLKIFSLSSNRPLAEKIAEAVGLELGKISISRFSDGEVKVNVEESIRGAHVYIVQSTSDPVNDNLMELLIMIDALRRASAKTINVVMPYYGYARQERKAQSREPITAKLVANLLQLTGMDRLITVDLHASQIQGFYSVPVDHLHAIPLLGQYFLDNGIATKEDDDIVVVSPDHSGAKLARNFGQYFNAPIAIVDQRGARYDTEVHDIIGDVKDKKCIIVDDIIDTGSRISSSTKSVMAAGAKKVYVAATHALLSKNATEVLNELPIEQIVVTDTIKHNRYPDRMVRISVDQLLARGIDYVYNDRSIHQIFDEQNRLN